MRLHAKANSFTEGETSASLSCSNDLAENPADNKRLVIVNISGTFGIELSPGAKLSDVIAQGVSFTADIAKGK